MGLPASQCITLVFVGGDDISSRVIEWFSAGPYSHVAAVWRPGYVVDSRSDNPTGDGAGVQVRGWWYLSTYPEQVAYDIPIASDSYAAWTAFMAKQIGKPYDRSAIWGFAAGRDWREDDSWFCSELQAAALEAAGFFKGLDMPKDKITPTTLAALVSVVGGAVEIPGRNWSNYSRA